MTSPAKVNFFLLCMGVSTYLECVFSQKSLSKTTIQENIVTAFTFKDCQFTDQTELN